MLDQAGNRGSPIAVTDDDTKVVLDTKTPTLSGITLISNNANDPQAFAKPGDEITLSFNSSESIQKPVITLADNASLNVVDTSGNQDGTSWSAVHTVSSTDTDDNVTFSIYFEDYAGNAVVVTSTTDDSKVTYDDQIPVLTPIVITSNNLNTASKSVDKLLAKPNDNVTLSFITPEILDNLTVTLATDNSTLYASWSENNQIRSAKYNNDGSTWTFIDGNGTTGLNYNTGLLANDYPADAGSLDSIVLSKYLYLIWMEKYYDGQDNADQVGMKRYNGSSWTMIDGNNATGINRNPTRQADSPRFAVYRTRIYATWMESSVPRAVIGE